MKLGFFIVFCVVGLVLFSGCTGSGNNSFPVKNSFGLEKTTVTNTAAATDSGEGIIVTIKDKPDPVFVDNSVKYIMEIRNDSAEELSDLSLSFNVSSEVGIVSATDEPEENLRRLEWKIDSIASHEFIKREVIAQATEAGSALVTAKFSGLTIIKPITVTEETEIEE